jgi:hypothetical protein
MNRRLWSSAVSLVILLSAPFCEAQPRNPDVSVTGFNSIRDLLLKRGWHIQWTNTYRPDDVSLVAVGRITELPESEIVLAKVRDAIIGSLSEKICPNDHCAAIEAAAGIDPKFFEIDPETFAPDGAPLAPAFVDARPGCADNGSEITALVFYTTPAEREVGGENVIKAYIRYAEATTNIAFARSGLTTKLRVVDIKRLEFAEAGLTTSTILQVFTDAAVIHDLRDTAKADIVFLIVNGGDECGRAHLMPADPAQYVNYHESAYAVVRWSCIRCNWSFTHELGHLLGACHEYDANDCTNGGTVNFAHSESQPSANPKFMTLNASKDRCQDCARLNQWSTSDAQVLCGTSPTGGPTEDNANFVKNTVGPVAKFRCNSLIVR